MQALIKSGFNNVDENSIIWDGPGINSSTARDEPNGVTGLGFAVFEELGIETPTFLGVNVGDFDSNDIVVKYTYYGDANLNGVVNGEDFQQFLGGFGHPEVTQTWLNGDFDYNGVVNGEDFGAFLYGFQNQQGPLSASQPEEDNLASIIT